MFHDLDAMCRDRTRQKKGPNTPHDFLKDAFMSHAPSCSITSNAAWMVLSSMPGTGIDDARVETILGVPRHRLRDPELRLELDRFYELLEYLDALLPVAHWALEVPAAWDIEHFDVLGYLIYTSASVGQSLERFITYRTLWADGEDFWLEARGDSSVCIGWRGMGASRRAHACLCDLIVSDLILGTQSLIERSLEVESIHFCYPEPADLSLHHACFGPNTRLVFDAPWLTITLPKSSLELTMPRADERLHNYFEKLARVRVASRLHATHTHRAAAQRLITRALAAGHMPDIETIALQMNASPRTLQRWLRDEGVTFRALCDQVRQDLALNYLLEGLSVQEVSWLLDFSEPRAFHRAFKRWTSTSPGQWLAQHTS